MIVEERETRGNGEARESITGFVMITIWFAASREAYATVMASSR